MHHPGGLRRGTTVSSAVGFLPPLLHAPLPLRRVRGRA